MNRPLDGVRVLDVTQFLSGPFCTLQLADLGADVIKIEAPGGEPQRNAMRVNPGEESLSFLTLNRNKRGIVLNLRADDGREAFQRLLATADVMVENFRPGTTARLGIDYETVRALRPELIYASITGFGDGGPWADRPGLDAIAQSMSGLMSITGYPGGEPAKIGVPITDLTAGLYGAIGILGALFERQRTGQGQRVTTSLFEAGVGLALHESAQYWTTGKVPGPLGSGHRLAAPYQAVRTKDGHVTIGAGTQKLWERMCAAIGREDLLRDQRFGDNNARMAHLADLVEELQQTFSTETSEHWTDVLIAAGVPAGPIMTYQQVLEHPHTQARDMVVAYDHPRQGRLTALGSPVKIGGPLTDGMRPAPMLGQHTDEVMAEVGYTPDRLSQLREEGVL